MDAFNFTLFALCGLLLIHISTVSGAVAPAPLPGTDGICYTYIVQGHDTCTSIGKQHSITVADIEAFNKNSWAWLGCDKPLYQGAFICLSAGAAPMPVALPQATCGPQVPGTTRPSNFDLVGTLNPCPNKECVSEFMKKYAKYASNHNHSVLHGEYAVLPRNFVVPRTIHHTPHPHRVAQLARQLLKPLKQHKPPRANLQAPRKRPAPQRQPLLLNQPVQRQHQQQKKQTRRQKPPLLLKHTRSHGQLHFSNRRTA